MTLELERADVSALVATGWQAPESFVVKARDQQTDLYGLLYRPSQFDPERSYPILNYLYPGPQSGSVGSRGFQPVRRDKQAVAELGFIVVEVDAMGTPGRSKSFMTPTMATWETTACRIRSVRFVSWLRTAVDGP